MGGIDSSVGAKRVAEGSRVGGGEEVKDEEDGLEEEEVALELPEEEEEAMICEGVAAVGSVPLAAAAVLGPPSIMGAPGL